MRKTVCFAPVVLFVCSCRSACADVAAIHTNALPNDSSITDALKDVTELEPYTHLWTPNWKYPVAKSETTVRLNRDMVALNDAVRNNLENVELLLLAGLAGRYAYNVDVSGVFDSSISDLTEAARLAPADVRSSWFRAALLCQTADQLAAGAREFLAVETTHDSQQLPRGFWEDYMECATVTDMPAHALRAADHIQQLHAASDETMFLTQTAQKLFDSFDPRKDYAPKEIWAGARAENEVILTSTTCGLRMHVHDDWEINQLELNNGSCVANFSLGPYEETHSKRRPSILVMVQRPQKNETLESYSKRFMTKGSFEPYTPSRCPADQCIAVKGVRPGGYGKDGDGHGFTLIFERDQPPFPGLIFESPTQPPRRGNGEETQYNRPSQTQERIPGKLYYLVLLDTAASIEEPAMKDFYFFLQNLTAE